jgi:hypothetical protein
MSGNKLELSADVRLAPQIVRGGTFAGWQKAVGTAAATHNAPHWVLGIAAGFTGCILQLVGLDTCGVNWSGPSSCGKTLAQQLGVSVWTSPRLTSGGLLKPARFTTNSIELLARQSNGLVLGLDELALIDGRTLAQVIYGLAAGVGKARMTVGSKLDYQIKWATFVLLSCEQTLEVKINSERGKWTGGMAARFVDVDCSDINRAVAQDTIAAIRRIERHYGVAGPEFIRRFKTAGLHLERDGLRQRIVKRAGELADGDGDVPGSHKRAALPLALIETAGRIAKQLEILPPTVDVDAAVTWAWAGYSQSAGAAALSPEDQADANLRRWVAERYAVTIKNVNRHTKEWNNNREAVGWYDNQAVYVPADRIVDACGSGLSQRAIGHMLADRQLLIKGRKDRLPTVNYVPGLGLYVTCFALKSAEFAPQELDTDDDA